MTTKQWYRVLLEDRVLKNNGDDGTTPTLLPVRVELLNPNLDWPLIWKLPRTKGLKEGVHQNFIFSHNVELSSLI